LDIAEKRKPQDSRISYSFINKNIDIRVAIIPTTYGEKIVLRILGSSMGKDIPDLKNLNLSKNNYILAQKIISSPNGIFFITGPTGSGKTTTLFSMLKYLNKPEINILTIEDPVEYKLKGINQVQVNKKVGLDFSTALRSFLRLDPDVILIGEIRDVETAKIASQAALTGHLVLATMHTNSSLQAVTRLIEIGVEPFLVAPSLIGVMAQRLVRKICDNCKEKYSVSKEELENYFSIDTEYKNIYFYKGKGCHYCNNSGYKGRVAIHETLVINEELRRLIARDASSLDLEQEAYGRGFKSMWYDGLKKVLTGLTTIDEVKRVINTEMIE
ncbi:MAG: GspE/PulE family protein, partial [Vampirovibrionia bacterium]